jgi:uncharacterized protein (TIGR03118 family)
MQMPATVTAFDQDNLVSSRAEDGALMLDPAFINAWGLAIRPAGAGGHWWITNTDTSRVTLYVGDSPTVPFTQDGLSVLGVPGAPGGEPVTIVIDPPTVDGVPLPAPNPTPATVMPPSNPTGQVFSGSVTDFLVDGTSLTGAALEDAPARFITVSEDGTIAAWGEFGASAAQRMDAFAVVIDNSETGAIYKGVTVSADAGSGLFLYAANFSGNAIEVYDGDWNRVETSGFVLTEAPGGRDPALYAPFNIERVTDAARGEEVLIVAYAKVANAEEGEEESTDGFIAKYTLDGELIATSDADGLFNAPWGVALAPEEWGDFDGALLVGNFGDGRILALDAETLAFEGFLTDGTGAPIVIDGLWDLIFGNGESLGAADRLYFAAGPEEETEGLFGSLAIAGTGASVGPRVTMPVSGVLVADQGDNAIAGSGKVLLIRDGEVGVFFDDTNASGLASPSENVFTLLQATDRSVYAGDGDTDAVYRLRDRNNDGDANDEGEATLWFSEANAEGFTLPTPNGLAEGPDGAIYIVNAGVASRPSDAIYRTVDLNDDGDANDEGEALLWLNLQTVVATSSPFEMVFSGTVAYLLDPSGAAPDTIWRIEDRDGSGTIIAAGEVTAFAVKETAFGAPLDFSLGQDGETLLVWEWLDSAREVWSLYGLTDLDGSGAIDQAAESVELWNSTKLPEGFWPFAGFSVAGDGEGTIVLTSNGADANQRFVVALEDRDGDGLYAADETTILASGVSTPDTLYRPRAVEFYEGPVAASHTALGAGNHFSLFLKDGVVHAAGENIAAQLSLGAEGFDIPAPVPITLPDGFDGEIVSVSAGLVHGSLLTAEGDLYTWGLGNFGRLGHGDQENRTVATRVEALADETVVVATHGNGASYAITDTGALYAWGQNTNGQLGLGDLTNRLEPTQVDALASETIVAVATGTSHTLALTADGEVYAWGANRQGQLGSPDGLDASGAPLTRVTAPVKVAGPPENVVSISASTLTSYAITADGRVFGWGEGRYGQLLQGSDNGDGTFDPASANVPVPVELTALPDNVVDVKGGARWAIALTADGDVYAWGPNDEGPTGGLDGDQAAESDASFYPTKIAALDAAFIVEIATGPNHVMARASDGRVFSFGANSDGRLGYVTEGLTTEPSVVPFPADAPPWLVTAEPYDNATGVVRNGPITLTFTEAVTRGEGTITLANLDDPTASVTIDVADQDLVAIDGSVVTLTLPEVLGATTRYAISITEGAFVDDAGQAHAGIAADDTATFNIRTGEGVDIAAVSLSALAVSQEGGGTPPGTVQGGALLDPAALGAIETAPIMLDGATWARIENEGVWNGLKNLALDGFDAAWGDHLLVANFVDVRLDLADAGNTDLTLTVVGAKRGEIATAAGDDDVTVLLHSNTSDWSNVTVIETGAGDDVITLGTVGASARDDALLADNAAPANGSFWNSTYDGRFSTVTVEAGAGNDVIIAEGRMTLTAFGGQGDDRLVAGRGRDLLSGGEGDDVFVLSATTAQGDVILDFGSGDQLDLAGFGAGAALNHLGGGLWLASGAAGEASFMVLAGGSAVTALAAEDYAFV